MINPGAWLLDADPLPSLGPATREDLAPGPGGHSFPESVFVGPLPIGGLKRSFHRLSILIHYMLSDIHSRAYDIEAEPELSRLFCLVPFLT